MHNFRIQHHTLVTEEAVGTFRVTFLYFPQTYKAKWDWPPNDIKYFHRTLLY